jgi:hypothetical protein
LKNAVSLVLLAALAACSVGGVIGDLAPDNVQQASKKALSDLRAGHFADVDKVLVKSLGGEDHDSEFARMAAFFPAEPEKSFNLVGYYVTSGTGGTRHDITYEYGFSRSWILAQLSWVKENGELRLLNFHVTPMAQSLEEANAFTLRGKGPLHYGILLLGVIVALLSLYALVACIRTKNLPRKWLWIVFILFGLGSLSLNWTTGEWQVGLLRFQLLSFSAAQIGGSNWIVAVSVPFGAIVFLDKLRKGRKAREGGGGGGLPPVI